MMKCRAQIALMTLIVGIAGCSALRSSYTPAGGPLPDSYVHTDQDARASLDQWWRHFGDPQLEALIEEALQRNVDLARAVLRVREAQLQQHLAVINPTVTAGYQYDRSKVLKRNSSATDSHSLSLSASYEVDLWGHLAALRDAAAWEARATEADRQSAALLLIGNAVDVYYRIAELNQRVLIGENSIAYAIKTLELVKALEVAGAASKLEIAESEQSLASQKAAQAQLIQLRVEARDALTVLLNGSRWPQARELSEVPQGPPPAVAADLPASLLQRRPDLRAAQMRLRESLASTDAVRLSFYPQITLTGSLGTAATGFSSLLDNPTATILAALTAPFVQVNQAQLSTRLARAQYEEAGVAFRKTLITALYDVENALSAREQLAQEAQELEHSLAAAREVERIYEVRYRAGAVALRFWLDAQETRRQAEIALADNQLSRLQNYSALCQALGGGAERL